MPSASTLRELRRVDRHLKQIADLARNQPRAARSRTFKRADAWLDRRLELMNKKQ